MSCTVIAVPTLIAIQLWHIAGLAIATGIAAGADKLNQIERDNALTQHSKDMENNFYKEVKHIQACNFIEKEFQTAYMGKDILLKTLEEHGATDIKEESGSEISASVGTFTLNFYRTSETEPYTLKITCKETDNAEEKIDDLNSEYALNVQEDAYLNLIENLKANNMEIEDEVVEDDNTIVLTINLE